MLVEITRIVPRHSLTKPLNVPQIRMDCPTQAIVSQNQMFCSRKRVVSTFQIDAANNNNDNDSNTYLVLSVAPFAME